MQVIKITMMKINKIVANKGKFPDFVAYHFVDAEGHLVAMEEDGGSTEKILSEGGLSVDGSSIKGMGCGVEKSDLRLIPEPESFLSIQLDKDKDKNKDCGDEAVSQHYRFLAHLVDEHGKPHPRDPRGILCKLVEKAHTMGFEPYMFSEIEFYIVNADDGTPVDNAGYCSLPPEDKSYPFRHELGQICKEQLGMHVKRIHHECGPGQNEIELNLTPCMKNADDTILCMWIMQLLAAKRNQRIIFSPKPFSDEAGNGMHHHILLRDLQSGANVFVNKEKTTVTAGEDETSNLSETCQHGIAGLLKYADDITAAFAASSETFARLRPGFEAPIFKTWGFSNRSALVRVPQTSSLDSTRFEYRGGDLSGSVHLFGAVLLAAVLRGIEEKLELPPKADDNVEALTAEELKERNIQPVPLNFDQCIDVLKTSTFLRDALGPEMVKYLIDRDMTLSQAEYLKLPEA